MRLATPWRHRPPHSPVAAPRWPRARLGHPAARGQRSACVCVLARPRAWLRRSAVPQTAQVTWRGSQPRTGRARPRRRPFASPHPQAWQRWQTQLRHQLVLSAKFQWVANSGTSGPRCKYTCYTVCSSTNYSPSLTPPSRSETMASINAFFSAACTRFRRSSTVSLAALTLTSFCSMIGPLS